MILGDDSSIIVKMTRTNIKIIYSRVLFFILIIEEESSSFFHD